MQLLRASTRSSFAQLIQMIAAARINVQELLVAFGTAKSFWHISVHEIARCLGPSNSITLLMFHAYAGCDMV